jgi:hypothetical protein
MRVARNGCHPSPPSEAKTLKIINPSSPPPNINPPLPSCWHCSGLTHAVFNVGHRVSVWLQGGAYKTHTQSISGLDTPPFRGNHGQSMCEAPTLFNKAVDASASCSSSSSSKQNPRIFFGPASPMLKKVSLGHC